MADNIPNTITLSIYDADTNSYGVAWQTDAPGSPVLEYCKQENSINIIEGVVSDSIGTYKNSVVLSNLTPGTTYKYRVGDKSGTMSEWHTFKTLPKAPSCVSFFYIADSQDEVNRGRWLKTAWTHALKNYKNADFLMHGGDIVQLSGDASLWRDMLDINRDFFCSYPTIACAGNHDYWECYLFGYKATFEKHFLYNYPPQNVDSGVYYSQNIGNVHFTVLNSGTELTMESDQYNWLKKDLADTDKKWKIVLIHNPLYSPGKYGSRPGWNSLALTLRESLNSLFAEYNVDLVLSGHDHVFSKSYPILRDGAPQKDCKTVFETYDGVNTKFSVKPDGPIHFVSGCSGNQNRNCHDNIDEKYLEDLEEYHDTELNNICYSFVKIENDTLYVSHNMVCVDSGKLTSKHTFAIKK